MSRGEITSKDFKNVLLSSFLLSDSINGTELLVAVFALNFCCNGAEL